MATNDITGDIIRSKVVSNKYSIGWDAIFNQQKPKHELDRKKDRIDLGLSPSCIIEEFEKNDQ